MKTKYSLFGILAVLAVGLFSIPSADAYILDVEFDQENYLTNEKVKFTGSTISLLGERSEQMVYYEIMDPLSKVIQSGDLSIIDNSFNSELFLGNSNLVKLGPYTLTVHHDRNQSSFYFSVLGTIQITFDYEIDFENKKSPKSIIIKAGETVLFQTENKIVVKGKTLNDTNMHTFEKPGFYKYVILDTELRGIILVTYNN